MSSLLGDASFIFCHSYCVTLLAPLAPLALSPPRSSTSVVFIRLEGGEVAPCSLAVRSMRRGRRSRTFTNFPAAAPGAVVDADERGGRGGCLTVSGGGFMGRWAVVTGKQLFQVRNFAEREMIIQGESGWSHRDCRSQISRPRLRAPPWKTCGGDRGGRSAVWGGRGGGGTLQGGGRP